MKKLNFILWSMLVIPICLLLSQISNDFFKVINNDINLSNFDIRSSILGKRVGNIQKDVGHMQIYPNPKKTIDVIVIPYQKGFKVVFKPLDRYEGHFVCPLNNYVLQNHIKRPFNFISNSKSDFFNTKIQKNHGYIEGNAVHDSCSIYRDTISWIVFGDKVDFDPSQPYTVVIGEIENKMHKLAKFNIDIKKTTNNTYLTTNHLSTF